MLKYIFGIFLSSMFISLSNVSNFVQKWSILYFLPILAATFVTIAMVKVKLIPDFITWAIAQIN